LSDYAQPAARLSALMELPTIFIFTHEAMGDGEDGPTHQPEQLVSLRAMPGLVTLRPADANEVVDAFRYVMQLRHQPPCWRSRASPCQPWIAASTPPHAASGRVLTCSPTRRARGPR